MIPMEEEEKREERGEGGRERKKKEGKKPGQTWEGYYGTSKVRGYAEVHAI